MVEADDLKVDIWEYYKYDEELRDKDLLVLVKELKKVNQTPDGEWDDKVREKKGALENAIADKLGLVSADMLQEWQNDVMEKIAEEISDNFAKFRNHRHDYSKTFTGKAEY